MFSNRRLRHLLIPLIIEQVLTSLVGTVDTMMVSNVGSFAVSGVSLVDSINKLIYGTVEDCVEATKEVLSIMKPGGGYILSPSHDYLLEMTPVENVLAMYDTCYELGAY